MVRAWYQFNEPWQINEMHYMEVSVSADSFKLLHYFYNHFANHYDPIDWAVRKQKIQHLSEKQEIWWG